MLLNFFAHIKGKPHPAQSRTASPVPHGSCKATKRLPTGTAKQGRKRPNAHKRARRRVTESSPEERVGTKQNVKEACYLPTEIQDFGDFPLQGRPSAAPRGRWRGCSKPPLHPYASSDGNGNWQPSRSPRSEALSLQQYLGRSSAPCRSLHSFTPHLSKLRLFLAFTTVKEWGEAGRKRTESFNT